MNPYDRDDDEGYDRARDAWDTGDGNQPMTRRQRQAWADECNQWRDDRRWWG